MPKATEVLRHTAVAFTIAFAVLAAATGYWTLIARDSLITRPDNPRTLIAFNRIHRGDILDRDGQPLAQTTGEPGNYTRRYEVAAAHVVGYASFRFGLSGVEAAADSILTGAGGVDEVRQWWHRDVLGEPQIGRDLQLTLDLDLQRSAFDALQNHAGAAVVVEVATGDVLALASAPSFDPARLDTDFESINTETGGPLINRATNALYPADGILDLFPSTLDLASPLEFPISVRPVEGRKVSPLQIALLTAALGNNGELPAPRLIAAVCNQTSEVSETSEVLLCESQPAPGHPIAVIPPDDAKRPRAQMNFEATEPSGFEDQTVGWFIGLSPDGTRAVCIVLEDSTGAEAAKAATTLIP
jgi:cell division protein FtsI/penicillin-binding protein 2